MRRFKLPKPPPKIPSSSTKSIRFPNDVIEAIEKAIQGTECSFTAFVVEAARVALYNLAEDSDENESKP